MGETIEILTQYGVLGVWVIYATMREKWLLKKLEDLSLRFDSERENWHEEREQYKKEIAMIRLEERNFFINEIDKILKQQNKIIKNDSR